jgi:hypothetical protein
MGDIFVMCTLEAIGSPGDIDIEVMVRSNQELYDFIDKLRFTFPGAIGEYQTITFMDTLKVRYLPF